MGEPVKRRWLLLAAGGALAVRPALAAPQVMVIYVGGWDCPYCTQWKNDAKPRWIVSQLFRKVHYVEIEAPHLVDAYHEQYWPDDLRAVLAQVPDKSGTPRFLVLKDGKLIANESGVAKWAIALEAVERALAEA